MRRVVVTGLGMIAPTGNGVADAWEAALSGTSAVGRISLFDASTMPVQIAAEVRGFDPTTVMSAKQARQSSRFVQFAAAAAKEAVEDSGIDFGSESNRCGCAIGVGLGGNSTHIGATANLIAVTEAEKCGIPGARITPLGWMRVGIPVTVSGLALASLLYILFFDFFVG